MKRSLVLLTLLIVAAGSHLVLAQTRTHELKLLPQNVHWGYYDARVKPALRIASGDTVRVETMVARGIERLRLAGVKDDEIPQSLKDVESAITDRGPGAHPLTGPIYIEGAEQGDSLEVHIEAIEFLHPYGVGGFIPGGGTLPEDFPYAKFKLVRVNEKAGTGEFSPGVTLKLAPFFGLDNKELVVGSTLYLPVHVPGGLLSIGDGHGLQGDGEVSLTALETSLRGTIRIVLRKGKLIKWPRAETPTHYIAMGLNEDLDQAAKLATREMIDFLVAEKGLSRDDAYVLCSLAVDLHVTQLVDQTKGVHAMLPKSIFR